jgi:hypothetical protein
MSDAFKQDTVFNRLFREMCCREPPILITSVEIEEMPMTEQEWLTSDDPAALLDWCQSSANNGSDLGPYCNHFVSDRKLRLFAVACCRHIWQFLTDERSRKAVEVAERYADGRAMEEQLSGSCRNWGPCETTAVRAAEFVVSAYIGEAITQAALLRDIIGNPFRPVALPLGPLDYFMKPPSWHKGPTYGQGYYLTQCSWLTPTVRSLAQAAYEERVSKACERCKWPGATIREGFDAVQAVIDWGKLKKSCHICHGTGRVESGELDPNRLGILADALEDAGCEDEDVLRHLRGEERCTNGFEQHGKHYEFLRYGGWWEEKHLCKSCNGTCWRPLRGPHVRGCWVLDLLLGKE